MILIRFPLCDYQTISGLLGHSAIGGSSYCEKARHKKVNDVLFIICLVIVWFTLLLQRYDIIINLIIINRIIFCSFRLFAHTWSTGVYLHINYPALVQASQQAV